MGDMDDLDAHLAHLARSSGPPGLDDIDDRVLARIGARPPSYRPGVGLGAMTIVALSLGILGGGLPAGARASGSLAALGGVSQLAPSSLLAGD